MYESNMVFWNDWERCTRRDQELTHTHKETALVVDQKTGTIRSAGGNEEQHADVSSDLLVYLALRRRGLALPGQCGGLRDS
eukprot:395582-Amphidinium_carterae.1